MSKISTDKVKSCWKVVEKLSKKRVEKSLKISTEKVQVLCRKSRQKRESHTPYFDKENAALSLEVIVARRKIPFLTETRKKTDKIRKVSWKISWVGRSTSGRDIGESLMYTWISVLCCYIYKVKSKFWDLKVSISCPFSSHITGANSPRSSSAARSESSTLIIVPSSSWRWPERT